MITDEGRKLTKTVAEGTALFTANTLAQKFIGVASALVLANGLTVYAYGLLKLAQSAVSIGSTFFFSGTNSVVIAEVSRELGAGERGRAMAMLRDYALAETAIGAVVAGVFLAASPVAGIFLGPGWTAILVSSAPLVFLGAVRMIAAVVFQVETDFRSFTLLKFAESLFALASVAVTVFLLGGTVQAIMGGYAVAQALALAVVARPLARGVASFRGAPRSRSRLLSVIRAHGIWAIMIDYAKNLSDNARLWIIAAVAGVEGLAVYSLADSLIGHTTSLFPLSQTLLPVVSKEVRDVSRMRRVFVRSVKYHLIAYLALMAAGFTLFPWILHFLFPKYDRSLPVYQVMLLSLPILAFSVVLGVYMTTYRQQKKLFYLTVARDAISLGLVTPLAWAFGAVGAAAEYAVTSAAFMLMRLSVLWRVEPELRFSPRDLVSVDDFDRDMARGLVARARSLIPYVRH